MKIELLSDWGGAASGTVLSISNDVGKDLIQRKIAKEVSARKGAGKPGGKE